MSLLEERVDPEATISQSRFRKILNTGVSRSGPPREKADGKTKFKRGLKSDLVLSLAVLVSIPLYYIVVSSFKTSVDMALPPPGTSRPLDAGELPDRPRTCEYVDGFPQLTNPHGLRCTDSGFHRFASVLRHDHSELGFHDRCRRHSSLLSGRHLLLLPHGRLHARLATRAH